MPPMMRNCASDLHALLTQWAKIPPNTYPFSVRGQWPQYANDTVRAVALYGEVVQWLDRFETLSGEQHPLRKSLPALFNGIVGAGFDWNGAAPGERNVVDGTALDQLKSFSYILVAEGITGTRVVYPSTPQTLAELRRVLDDAREFMLTTTITDEPVERDESEAADGPGDETEREKLRVYILTLINHVSAATQQLETGARIDLPSLATQLITALERFRDRESSDDPGIVRKINEYIERLGPWAGVMGAALQGLSVVLQITQ